MYLLGDNNLATAKATKQENGVKRILFLKEGNGRVTWVRACGREYMVNDWPVSERADAIRWLKDVFGWVVEQHRRDEIICAITGAPKDVHELLHVEDISGAAA